jgi:hypothetical protein
MNKCEYVCVIEGHPESFAMIDSDEVGKTFCPLKRFAEECVSKAGIKSPRKDPITVKVQTFKIGTSQGKIVKTPSRTITVEPAMERMTHEEYNEEKLALIAKVPEEFQDFIENYADDHGSSREEVIGVIESLVDGLRPCVDKFRNRISGVLVDIFDIFKISKAGEDAIKAGADDAGVRAAMDEVITKVRKN